MGIGRFSYYNNPIVQELLNC